jgi:hypothetical protein
MSMREIGEIESRPYVGGGPMHGRSLVTSPNNACPAFHHDPDDQVVPAEDAASADCYESVMEDGFNVMRYNRAKGETRGYRDRTIKGQLYRFGGQSEPQWIPAFTAGPDGVHTPEKASDEGPYFAACPHCAAPLVRGASRRVLAVASLTCTACGKHAVGADHPGAIRTKSTRVPL